MVYLSSVESVHQHALNPTLYVTDKDGQEHMSQGGTLRAIACEWPPPGHRDSDNNSLATDIQPTLYSLLVHPLNLYFSNLMISSTLVSTRFRNSSSLVSLSNTQSMKLSSVDFRSLLDCLQPTMLLCQQISGWLEYPIRTRACECDTCS